MLPLLDLTCTDPTRHLMAAGKDVDYLGYETSWAGQGAAMAAAWLCPAQFSVFGCDFFTAVLIMLFPNKIESLPFFVFFFVFWSEG